MNLQLSKPLVVFDLETTGLDIINDRIVEISLLKIEINGNRSSITKRINPGIPISAESSAIHGIFDKDVENEPLFKEVAADIKNFIGNSDLAGFNSNKFDIPMIMEEFLRNDVAFDISKRKCIDVQNIFHKMEKRTLEAAYQFYCDKTLENAHSAEADVTATYEVLEAQIGKYSELSATTEFLSDFSSIRRSVDLAGRIVRDDNDIEVFNFGKYKGKTVTEVFKKDPGYYSWMMKADFSQDTKKHLTAIKLREKKQLVLKIVCVGRNYAKHALELKNSLPDEPILFIKPDSSILQKRNAFYIPSFSKDVHYEVELVIRIRKMAKHVQKEFAHKYYDEIGLGIDFTARDLQKELKGKGLPWEKAKSFDGACVVGSFVKKSQFKNMNEISFKLEKNGEIVQQGISADMIFDVDSLIAHISAYFTLKIGDLIFTGTPEGVGPVKSGDKLIGYLEGEKNFSLNIK